MGQCSFLLTVLAFRCPLSVYSQIDSGCGIKIVALFISKKVHFLGTNPPTVQNKQPPAPNASNQTISPRRQESRNSAAPNERQQDIQQPKTCLATSLLHHGPENRIQKTSTVQETNWDAQREKACVNTYAHASALQICLQNICGQQQKFPMAGPHFWVQIWTPKRGPSKDLKEGMKLWPILEPILGSIFGPKNGVSHRRISLLPANVLQADLRPSSLNMNVNTYLFLFVRPKAACYCRGPSIAASFEHFFRPCFGGHDEAGLLAFEALRGSRLGRKT